MKTINDLQRMAFDYASDCIGHDFFHLSEFGLDLYAAQHNLTSTEFSILSTIVDLIDIDNRDFENGFKEKVIDPVKRAQGIYF